MSFDGPCSYCGSRFGRSDCAQCWHGSVSIIDTPEVFVDDFALHLPDKHVKKRRRPMWHGISGISKLRKG